jgi:Phage tail assembly chaperone
MATKIVLGKRPKNFKSVVTCPTPEGDQLSIECSFVYRTKREFGALLDEMFGQGAKSDEDASMKAALEGSIELQAKWIMKCMDGWNLDVEFSRESVEQLCDEFPAHALAIITRYRETIVDGRLGN